MEAIKKYKNLLSFYLKLNLIVLIFITFSSYYGIPLSDFKGYFYYALHLIILQITAFGFIYFFTLNKFIFRFLFSALFILYSFIAFWNYSLGISFSDGILDATLQSQPDIVYDLISWQLLVYVICSIIALYYLQKEYSKIYNQRFSKLFLLFCVSFIVLYFLIENQRYGTLKSRLPFNVFYETYSYFSKPIIETQPINFKVVSKQKNLKVYLVLGESVRADHLGLNGYKRNTTPNLQKEKNLISFKNAYTEFTYTGISLPQILTNQSIYGTKILPNYSLIDLANKAEITTHWYGNQTPEKSYLPFITSCTYKKLIDPLRSSHSFIKKSDVELLNIKSPDSQKNELIVYHMIGSHWYYEGKYLDQFRIFKPIITSKHLSSNTSEEIINSYDNTIVQLDYFLHQLISKIKQKNEKAILIYVSDHGELLGENGKWLHATEGTEYGQKNPAMMVWFSTPYLAENKIPYQKSLLKTNVKLPLDVIFHTVLNSFEIEGSYFNPKLSIFK